MEIILAIFIAIVLFILFSVVIRRKVYSRVDALENKKVHLMNRHVAEELGKVRDLNLIGETEELFESWRNEWDDINSHVFTNIEEELMDAEEFAEKYRFRKSFRILHHVEQTLNEVEQTINDIFEEVERLISSEKDSRQEIEKIDPRITEVRKKVLQNGYQLGKAEVVFEVELDEIENELERYEELTTNGNYTEAHQLVQQMKQRLDEIERKVSIFPELYRLCKQVIPEDLDHVQNGIRDMREEGFRVHLLGFDKEIHTHHETLLDLVNQLNKGIDDGVEEKIEQIKSRILEIYDELEKEALDKNFVVQRLDNINEKVKEAKLKFMKTKENVMAVKENYHLSDDKYEQQYQLEKAVDRLEKSALQINELIEQEDQLFSSIRVELEKWLKDYEEWLEPQEAFDFYLHNLRKDELEARDQIAELKQEIISIRLTLQKSNLPGLPNYIIELVDTSRKLVAEAVEAINNQPLDMERISTAISNAEKHVGRTVEQTKLLIEQAHLAENVIQYANRYRSKYPVLAAKIAEAEVAFREYEYEMALEKAAQTLEEIEPGALKRIEEVLLETSVS
ncbi:septation ring formation regulator EzrA [Bacillaceae bacterium W0354]